MKGLPEERCAELARYIVHNNATVRQAAQRFGISKSTVHAEVTKKNF
ncbi:sporulation transcriptional regulator SpoIIID [Intestinimonas sp. MSJ-38]|nr:sporulation transcriptional regulator SpoIIID [Intestinimonas sp. MSJ-38]